MLEMFSKKTSAFQPSCCSIKTKLHLNIKTFRSSKTPIAARFHRTKSTVLSHQSYLRLFTNPQVNHYVIFQQTTNLSFQNLAKKKRILRIIDTFYHQSWKPFSTIQYRFFALVKTFCNLII